MLYLNELSEKLISANYVNSLCVNKTVMNNNAEILTFSSKIIFWKQAIRNEKICTHVKGTISEIQS
jgi:predicted nuclease of restriction endonuclease-like RecB superfamily